MPAFVSHQLLLKEVYIDWSQLNTVRVRKTFPRVNFLDEAKIARIHIQQSWPTVKVQVARDTPKETRLY